MNVETAPSQHDIAIWPHIAAALMRIIIRPSNLAINARSPIRNVLEEHMAPVAKTELVFSIAY